MSSQTAGAPAHIKRQWLVLAASAVALFAVSYFAGTRLMAGRGQSAAPIQSQAGVGIVDPPHLLADFTLTSQTGEPISLSDLRGKAVLMFFGYTHCPDVCPGTLAEYTDVKRRLGEDAGDVEFVFISVDGTRDTPARLTEYLGMFDAGFIGMTGDEAALRALGNEYGLFFEQTTLPERSAESGETHEHGAQHAEEGALDQSNYFVQHTSPSFLIDRDGYLRRVFFFGTTPANVASGVQEILEGAA